MKNRSQINRLIAIAFIALTCSCCGGSSASSGNAPIPPAVPLHVDEQANALAIRQLEDKVKQNPEDFVAYTKLAGYYLERQGETGSPDYIQLAKRAARSSLSVLPAEMNFGGLAALAHVEFTSHNFAEARDHAKKLIEMDRTKATGFQILGDSLIELGDYDEATLAINRMQQLAGKSVGVETRLGRIALLRGQVDAAIDHFSDATILSLESTPPSRETIAWCRWQLGEAAFSKGDYSTAERYYNDSLITFPDYYRALASLGRTLYAKGDLTGATEFYERAVRAVPEVTSVAALGDLYKLAGKENEASAQYALIEQIARIGKTAGALYDRQIALFYADHDLKAEEAYTIAVREYEIRRDIYGADALAWTALKAGKIAEAQSAIKEALKLGTRDAKLFYHAGMIARAAGDINSARDYLNRALKLNARFDPLQSQIADKTLKEIGS